MAIKRKLKSPKQILQIVITRKDDDVFNLTTFSSTECLGNRFVDAMQLEKLISNELLDKLAITPGLK